MRAHGGVGREEGRGGVQLNSVRFMKDIVLETVIYFMR